MSERNLAERNRIYDLNMELARKIHLEVFRDPKSPYAGKWVGIANGQVVVVGDDWDDTHQRMHEIEPDGFRAYCFEAVGMSEEQMDDI